MNLSLVDGKCRAAEPGLEASWPSAWAAPARGQGRAGQASLWPEGGGAPPTIPFPGQFGRHSTPSSTPAPSPMAPSAEFTGSLWHTGFWY